MRFFAKEMTMIFQSTLPYGSDQSLHIFVTIADEFQSTLPYGSDLHTPNSLDKSADFNPRSLTGATFCGLHALIYAFISIHAPLRERQSARYVAKYSLKFQSTLPYGSDIRLMLQESLGSYFNPRSLTGATRISH